MITNKSKDQDLKVRFRVEQKEGATAPNVELRTAMTKMYLNGGHARLGCIFMKIDPTKPYFFPNMDDVSVALEVKERNTGLYSAGNRSYGNTNYTGGIMSGRRGGRTVGYAAQVETVGVGSPSSDGVDNGRDDSEAYAAWADGAGTAGQYPPGGQQEEQLANALIFGPESGTNVGVNDGNSSTGAEAHRSRQSSVTELDDVAGAGLTDCPECNTQNPANSFNCITCGTYIGVVGSTYYDTQYASPTNPNQMD